MLSLNGDVDGFGDSLHFPEQALVRLRSFHRRAADLSGRLQPHTWHVAFGDYLANSFVDIRGSNSFVEADRDAGLRTIREPAKRRLDIDMCDTDANARTLGGETLKRHGLVQ